jgi:hypothetical protein
MTVADLSAPQQIMKRLESIERDLADRQLELESAAMAWFRKKRDREHEWAVAFAAAEGTDARRRAVANRESSHIGAEEEGRWEGLKAVVRVLETRASIGQSLLRSHGRA